MNKEYSYEDYKDNLDSYSNSASDTNSKYSKRLAKKNVGIDLNDESHDFPATGRINGNENEFGENLNNIAVENTDAVLDSFKEENWSDLSLDEQKQSMTDLAACVAAETENKNPPEVIFRNDMPDGTYGGYSPDTNTLEINTYMLGDSAEAADTVAHEMWHAYQHQCSLDPASEKGREYQEAYENYISPEYDFEAYQNQMLEVEARNYAQGFKDKLQGKA